MESSDSVSLGIVKISGGVHGATLVAELENLPPGEHAFHLHETGDCAPGFKRAGGHFNPTGKKHGFHNEGGYHLGDMPNITVPASGSLTVSYFLPGLSVCGADGPLLDEDGAAAIIHLGADDYQTDPAGNAGERIACGVLRR